MKTLTKLCRRHKTTLWGQPHFVTPRLVDWIHGDGLQVVCFEPLATRPDYYVVRVDSRVEMLNTHANPFCDILANLGYAIECQFGLEYEEWTHENGRTYKRHNLWPALHTSCGSYWGKLAILTEPDRRSEYKVRQAIARAKKGKR